MSIHLLLYLTKEISISRSLFSFPFRIRERQRFLFLENSIYGDLPPRLNNGKKGSLACAVLIHLSAEDYPSRLSILREEWENTFGKKSGERSWLTSNIDFLTNYGQKVLEERKEKNISHLLLLLQELPH